jgi:hypothetical protein
VGVRLGQVEGEVVATPLPRAAGVLTRWSEPMAYWWRPAGKGITRANWWTWSPFATDPICQFPGTGVDSV